MRITANGNIGIGTTSPSANLHVVGNAIISTALSVGTINVAPAIGAAFDKANAANVLAFTSGAEAEGAFLRSNVTFAHANAAFFQANQAFADANTAEAWAAAAFLRSNVAFSQANQAFAVANTSGAEAEGAFLRSNVTFAHANAAFFQANQAFAKANTIGTLGTQASSSVSITGGTITGVTIDATSVDGISIGTLTAAGGIAYAFNTTQLRAIGAGTTDQVLTSQGSSAPTWQSLKTVNENSLFGTGELYAGLYNIGTFTPTSGDSDFTITGLDISVYKMLIILCLGIETNSSTLRYLTLGTSSANDIQISQTVISASSSVTGFIFVDVASGRVSSLLGDTFLISGDTTITGSTTQLYFALSGNAFGSGVQGIKIYGVS
jgi:hypothetical protein